MAAGARRSSLSISVTADLLGFSPIQSSPGVTENGLKYVKIPSHEKFFVWKYIRRGWAVFEEDRPQQKITLGS